MAAILETPELIQKNHPATQERLAEVSCTPLNEVPNLVRRARDAQVAWARLSVKERGTRLLRLSEVLADSADSLVTMVSRETGKPRFEALMHEVFTLSDLAYYFGKKLPRILKAKKIPIHLLKYKRSYIHYAPRGVVAVIGPWNFPFTLVMGDIIMALGAGNGVVLKPSEVTPLIALEIPKLLEKAGIDPALCQVALGYGDVGAKLIDSGVDMVHFTGSGATGRKIAAACGERLIPCVLELGGKDAAVVLDDADLDYAAAQIVHGAMANSGQVCASTERVYVQEAVYEAFVKRVIPLVEGLRQGDGTTENVDVGPMITPMQLKIVQQQVEDAISAGATVRVGAHAHGPYYSPTVLTDVDESMAICRDETFGPVLPIMKVKDVDEAVARANDSEYGLNAYVFSKDVGRGRRVAERLEAGSVMVNDCLINHGLPETPWGGVKNSGIGRTHSDDGLRHLCEERHVLYSVLPNFKPPWIYPYKEGMTEAATDLTRGLFGSENVLRRGRRLVGGAVRLLRAMRG